MLVRGRREPRRRSVVEGQVSMQSKPVALLLADLGVTKTHSRPHVSNDNPSSEAQFKTLNGFIPKQMRQVFGGPAIHGTGGTCPQSSRRREMSPRAPPEGN